MASPLQQLHQLHYRWQRSHIRIIAYVVSQRFGVFNLESLQNIYVLLDNIVVFQIAEFLPIDVFIVLFEEIRDYIVHVHADVTLDTKPVRNHHYPLGITLSQFLRSSPVSHSLIQLSQWLLLSVREYHPLYPETVEHVNELTISCSANIQDSESQRVCGFSEVRTYQGRQKQLLRPPLHQNDNSCK